MSFMSRRFYRSPRLTDRRLWAGLFALLLLPAGILRAQDAELSRGREHLLRGRYAEAVAELEPLRDASPAACLLLIRAHEESGRRTAAQRELQSALEKHPASPAVLAAAAEADYSQGNYPSGDKRLAAALEREPLLPHALRLDANRLERLGDFPAATRRRLQAWGVAQREREKLSPDDLLQIARALGDYARRSQSPEFYQRLVKELYPAILAREPNAWPAHADLARLFLEKYNEADAAEALQAGLAINPRAADLHALEAEIALSRYDLPRAEKALERARKHNPTDPAAQISAADLLIADVRPSEALPELEAALRDYPVQPALLGRKLACLALVHGVTPAAPSPAMAELLSAWKPQASHAGELEFHAGQACERMRHFPLAAAFYRQALAHWPDYIYTRGELGLVLMRLGDEAAAAPLLKEAFALDPFHVRVSNTLQVLELLQGYAVLETEHFVLKFDRGRDELLARCMARELETSIWPEVTRELAFEPPQKTLIEIFSRGKNTGGHGWFSARMVGLPFIGTVGACAGQMVAIVSPQELPKGFDWGRVLRHEFTHVVNLQQTDFRTPHWLTEGIAVRLENTPRPPEWNLLLRKRLEADQLFTLKDITWGFVRPSSHEDWTLAYCQAELYVEFLAQHAGAKGVAELLSAFRERADVATAIQRAAGMPLEEFERGYRDFLHQTVEQARPPVRLHELPAAELARRLAENAADADLLAAQARAAFEQGKNASARKLALEVFAHAEHHPAASYVLARLQLLAGDQASAVELLAAAHDAGKADADSLALAAELALQAGDSSAAEKLLLRGETAFPRWAPWRKQLARVYLQKNAAEPLQKTLEILAADDPDNILLRKKLAQLYLAAGDFPRALVAAREAIRLNVSDPLAQAQLGLAHSGLGQHEFAAESLLAALDLGEENEAWRIALVRACLAAGKLKQAQTAAEPLRRVAPADDQQKAELEQLLRQLDTATAPAPEKSKPKP